MSKALENAIAKLRKLPVHRQEMAAECLLEYVLKLPEDSERVSIEEARQAYSDGDFATLATWKLQIGL